MRQNDKPLALCCHEDVTCGIEECTRSVFSQWWADVTGIMLHELTDDGELIPWDRLSKQVIPPQRRAVQRVLTEPIAPYPWTREHFGQFVESSKWVFARTAAKTNPHEYVLSTTTLREDFENAVLFIRENGYAHKFGSRWYTQLDHGEHFYWNMGADLAYTILVNRKLRDPEAQVRRRERVVVGNKEAPAKEGKV